MFLKNWAGNQECCIERISNCKLILFEYHNRPTAIRCALQQKPQAGQRSIHWWKYVPQELCTTDGMNILRNRFRNGHHSNTPLFHCATVRPLKALLLHQGSNVVQSALVRPLKSSTFLNKMPNFVLVGERRMNLRNGFGLVMIEEFNEFGMSIKGT